MKLNEIDQGKSFDWGRTSCDYAKYRDIYPADFYEKIIEKGLCTKGQHVLDLGTGTGVLPRNMYKFGAKFWGADISPNQIGEARRLSKEALMDIEYLVAKAEEIDFPPAFFDAVTAVQCFWYFDKAVLLPKIHKMLKDDGYFLILSMSWLPGESEIAANSEKLVLKYNPYWSGQEVKRHPIENPDPDGDYFHSDIIETFDLNVPFTRESWHGRLKACRGIGASSLPASVIAKWEEEHLEYVSTLPEAFEIIHYATILGLKKRDQ
ncbi:MAG: class I SAM-dependent methyltransferase [Lachnospiraceae bacterium]|nr:class I SAM-dependent methyltransferase [Lachnospiraceae bacterium]